VKPRRRKSTAARRQEVPGRPRRCNNYSKASIEELTRQLEEAREQQIAIFEVLKLIARSPIDLQAVFDAVLEHATRICEANFGNLLRYDGKAFRNIALHNAPLAWAEQQQHEPVAPRDSAQVLYRIADTKAVIHISDIAAENPDEPIARIAGARTLLIVPMLNQEELVGAIAVYRQEVRLFNDRQIELLANFAAQAVIAIANVRLFEALQVRNRELAEASQHKSQFLANMSHELRTPLNAILGYTELIVDGIYGTAPEKMHAVLKRVESNGKHLLALINAVLDLSKIEANRLEIDSVDYSLNDIVETACTAIEPLAAEKRLSLKAEIATNLPPGRGDARRLTQVLLNLLGNAIKFTDSGEVSITATVSSGFYNLAVRDTGPGISPAEQAKLFQEFHQADNSITRKKGGTGLGLAISKRIVEMHGGRIWLESIVGKGSTFFVTLPIQVQR
jgi:signal transduction histidine kinase